MPGPAGGFADGALLQHVLVGGGGAAAELEAEATEVRLAPGAEHGEAAVPVRHGAALAAGRRQREGGVDDGVARLLQALLLLRRCILWPALLLLLLLLLLLPPLRRRQLPPLALPLGQVHFPPGIQVGVHSGLRHVLRDLRLQERQGLLRPLLPLPPCSGRRCRRAGQHGTEDPAAGAAEGRGVARGAGAQHVPVEAVVAHEVLPVSPALDARICKAGLAADWALDQLASRPRGLVRAGSGDRYRPGSRKMVPSYKSERCGADGADPSWHLALRGQVQGVFAQTFRGVFDLPNR